MGNRFSSGKFAISECDRCGFRFKLKELRELIVKTKKVPIKVCHQCWEPDHPQLLLGMYPVEDPQAVRAPRPDNSYYGTSPGGDGGSRQIQWGWSPVGGGNSITASPNSLVAAVAMGIVSVTS